MKVFGYILSGLGLAFGMGVMIFAFRTHRKTLELFRKIQESIDEQKRIAEEWEKKKKELEKN